MAILGHAVFWLHMDILGCTELFKALLGYTGLYLTIDGYIRLYMGVQGYACLDILGYSVI